MARKKEEVSNDSLSKEELSALKSKDREEKLKLFDSMIEKSSIKLDCRALEDESIENIEVIPTGILSVDRALKTFGFPKGRIIELYGLPGSGKTMLALMAAANIQRQGGIVLLFDLECAYSKNFGELLGVSDKLRVINDGSAEEVFDTINEVAKSGLVDLIIVDSVANLVPQAELDGTMADQRMGLLASSMSKGMRRITNTISKTGTTVIFINQIREKIGVMYGDPKTTMGGNALRFYASQRIEVTTPKDGKIMNGDKPIGHHAHIVVKKNKVGPPYGEGDMYVYYYEGIDTIRDTFDVARDENIIEGTTWLSYQSDIYKENNGLIKMQGADKFVEFIRANDYLACEIRDKVIKKIEKERQEFQKKRNLKEEENKEEKELGIDQE